MTQQPFKKDLTVYQGSVFDEPFQYLEEDGVTPINLTGVSMRMKARTELEAATAFLDLTTTNGGIVLTDAANGEFKIFVSATATAALTALEDGVYDLEVVPTTGADFAYKLLMGTIKVVREVTR